MSLLRKALQARKGNNKQGELSEPLTFSGPVLNADDILGIGDSGTLDTETPAATAGTPPPEEPLKTQASAVIDYHQPFNDRLDSTDPQTPVDSRLGSHSTLSDDSSVDQSDADVASTGIEYPKYHIDTGPVESSSDFVKLSIDGHTSDRQLPGRNVKEELATEELVNEEHAKGEYSDAERPVEAEPGVEFDNATTMQPIEQLTRQHARPGVVNSAAESQAVASTGYQTTAAAAPQSQPRIQPRSPPLLPPPRMNLDPLFFIIIAFACVGLFGSLYALVTQNDAFVNSEYAELRARQASLNKMAGDQQLADADNAAVESVDGAHSQNAIGTSASRSQFTSDAANTTDKLQAVAASESADDGPEAGDTQATVADGQTGVGGVVVAELASAENETEVSTETAVTDKSTGSDTPPVQNPDQRTQEIAYLQRELSELRQSLASQNSKISDFILDQTASRSGVSNADGPVAGSADIVTTERSVGAAGSNDTGDTSTGNIAGARDKAGDVIVVESRPEPNSPDPSGDSGLSVSPVDASVASKSASGMQSFGVSNQREIRIQASGANSQQTDFPAVLGQAFHAYTTGDLGQAGTLYARALQLDPYNRDANLGVAAVALKAGNYSVSIQRYRHLLSLRPDDAIAFSSMLNLVTATRDNALESEMVAHASQHRHVPALHAALGNFYSQTARWAEASRSYASAVGLAPDTADYLYNLAVSLDNLGDSSAAIETYQRALSLSEIGNYTFGRADATARVQALQQSR